MDGTRIYKRMIEAPPLPKPKEEPPSGKRANMIAIRELEYGITVSKIRSRWEKYQSIIT